jgi:hypothetical protein
MFTGFKRCMYIDTGVATEGCRETTRALAERLKLHYVESSGTLSAIREAVQRTKELAAGMSAPQLTEDPVCEGAGSACPE